MSIQNRDFAATTPAKPQATLLTTEQKMARALDNVHAFVLRNQPLRNQKAINTYTEVRDMKLSDHEQFGDSEFKEKRL